MLNIISLVGFLLCLLLVNLVTMSGAYEPFVLPMSTDGCPGEREEGWRISYINITTRMPFDHMRTSLPSCGKDFKELASHATFLAKSKNSSSNLLQISDKYTLKWNFCYKTNKTNDTYSSTSWPPGNYSVFGTEHGCSEGFTAFNMTSCFPPLLRHNRDGYLPYYEIEETPDSTIFTFLLCKRNKHTSEEDHVIGNIKNIFPFVLIKDPILKQCENIEGFDVTDEVVPGPIYSTVSDFDEVFPLTYCYYVNKTEEESRISYDLTAVWEKEGFNGVGTTHVHSRIIIPSQEYSFLDLQEGVESWVMIDARETRIVSAVLFQTYAFARLAILHEDPKASVSRIYIGDEQWSFLHGGALRCLFSFLKVGKKWNWSTFSDQELYSCWKSQYGRYVTMIFSSDKALGGHTIYNETCIVILTNEKVLMDIEHCNEELGMINYDIIDSQLTASTSQPLFPPTQARPHLSGWCSQFDDKRPYIQISFDHILSIHGIVLTNWYDVQKYFVSNKWTKTVIPLGTYSFKFVYGTSLHKMIHATKSFVVDKSQDLEIPQTFLLSEPLLAKYLRIYPTSFDNSTSPCLRFELLGCRQSEKQEFERYGARVDKNWSIYFDVPHIPINTPQEIASFGYPTTYAQNQFYKWNITFETRTTFLQFANISLNVYGETDFQNNMDCSDTIIISEHDVTNPLTFIKKYYMHDNEHITLTNQNKFRLLLTSKDNGRMIGVPQSTHSNTSIFLGLLACSYGPVLTKGHGFRVHVIQTEVPFCWSAEPMRTLCTTPSMELIAPNFLGMRDIGDTYRFEVQSEDKIVMMLKILDFDISCSSDSEFYIRSGLKDTRYCNKDIVQEQVYLIKTFRILYTRVFNPECENRIFPEGFHLAYTMLPRLSMRTNLKIDSRTFIKKEVCSNEFNKCYELGFMLPNISWTDSAQICQSQHMSLITFNSLNELSFIKQLIIDIYSDNYEAMVHSDYGIIGVVNSFIGLRRYEDMSGIQHEHWIDGTPLTFHAWDNNEPSETFVKLCSIMQLVPFTLKKENSLLTVPCDEKLPQTLLICETLENVSLQEKEKPTVNFEECYHPKAKLYTGNISVTHNGRQCQRWDSQFPHKHEFTKKSKFPDKTLAEAANFCRSPDNNHTPWCFTEDPLVPWEYCGVNSCPTVPQKDLVTLFKCNSGEWMSFTVICNGFIECFDGSDETNCTNHQNICEDDEFMCDSGRCIHVHYVCDFKPDCVDASDEFCEFPTCDLENEFKCTNGQCISTEMRCDSIKNCKDGTDEEFCEKCNEERAYQCADRTCIANRLVCDTYVDCLDGADEASCEHIYQTCDDVMLDGITEDGIYPIGSEGRPTRCTFNKTSSDIVMEYQNIDWNKGGGNRYKISVPEDSTVSKALTSRYRCYHEYGEYPQRERQRTATIENVTIIPDNSVWLSTFSFSTRTRSFYIYDSLNVVKSRMYYNDKPRCNKNYFLKWNENIHCSKGKSIDPSNRCIYDIDDNGIITGCRSLTHLKNCENVTCPRNHIKCINSYCIPLMYVCNGRIDCPDGQDEQFCECEGPKRSNILIVTESSDLLPYNRANLLFEMATRLGGALYSKTRSVRTLKVRLSLNQKVGKKYYFESSALKSNSEHPSHIFENVHQNETFESFPGIAEANQSAIIWLADKSDYSESEQYTFKFFGISNNSGTPLKYRIVIGHDAHGGVDDVNDDDVTQLKIQDYNILGTLGGTLFPSICKGQPLHCKDRYRCSLSMVCIPHEQVCDGKQHCPYGDDEELCQFRCPEICSCKPGVVICTDVHANNQTLTIPVSTRILDVSNTTDLGFNILTYTDSGELSLLISLNLSRCGITYLNQSLFIGLPNLMKLDISFNRLTKLSRDTFVHLHHLQELYMSGNTMLRVLEPWTFNGLTIESLAINDAHLERLEAKTFAGLTLNHLDLASNKIKDIADLTFSGLTCKHINIEDNPVTIFTKNIFNGVTGVQKLFTPNYKFCCSRPAYLNEENCLPYKDEFSSCTHLMRNTTLQGLMWTIGLLALTGNVLSVVYRLIYDRKKLKLGYGIFVTNLAISDLLMGIYMLIIATADKLFMDRYIEVEESWRNSGWCQFAGVISTISSEASVFFMCLITIDRFIAVKFPLGQYHFTTFTSIKASLIAWVLAVLIAIVPGMGTDYFQNKFYSRTGLCLALPLTRDRPPGWLYSIMVFIGFNLFSFALIIAGQLFIFVEGRKHGLSKKRFDMSRKNELYVARTLLLLVGTDILCWVPIGIMGMLALTGTYISGEVYAWIAVFVLPINSALNPFLYTFSSIRYAKKLADTAAIVNREEDNGRVIIDILPYFIEKNMLRLNRSLNLDRVLKTKIFSSIEIAYIIHNVVRYMGIVHENGLVFDGQITADKIFIQLTPDLKVSRKVMIMSLPSTSTQKAKTGGRIYDDIYDVGKLTEGLLEKSIDA